MLALNLSGVSSAAELGQLAVVGTRSEFYSALADETAEAVIEGSIEKVHGPYAQTTLYFEAAGHDFGRAYLALHPELDYRNISCAINQNFYNSLQPSAPQLEQKYRLQTG